MRLAVLAAGLFSSSAIACPGAPKSFTTWEAFRHSPAFSRGATIEERAEAGREEWRLREALAADSADAFFAGHPSAPEFWHCLESSPEGEALLSSLSAAFYRAAVKRLRQASDPSFHALLGALAGRDPLLFEVTVRPPTASAPEKGGFHRADSSVYMNIAATSPQEWLLIFVHESIHALDEELQEAIPKYGDRGFVSTMTGWLALGELSAEQTQAVRGWLKAGLDRGLLAEYRAWLLSFQFYQKGKTEGLWREIPWAEAILARKSRGESLESFTYAYLDPRFRDPDSGIFSHPLLREELRRLRGQLRNSPPALRGGLKGLW